MDKIEERILEILKVSRNNGLTKEEVYKKLAFTNLEYENFEEIFDRLTTENKTYNTGKNKYTLTPFKTGIVKTTKKGILVKTKDETIEISEDKLNCLTGDKVIVRITDFNQNKGTIKEVLERKGTIAEVKIMNKKKYAIVGTNTYELKTDSNLVDGMIIGIKLNKSRKDKKPVAELDRVFGHKNKPKIDEEMILYENNFSYEWPKEVIEELKYIPSEVKEEEKKGRTDLRYKTIFTIDGDDTKDIDDAISVEKLENGNYLLGVHIADVSNYIKEGSAIDKEAYARATSVYMNSVVNPMYPVELSNGICSLNPQVDRLAMTCEMEISPNGKIINSNIFESVIHSRKQMTYKNINKILEQGIVPEGYEEYKDVIKEMHELSKILNQKRINNGYQEYQTAETKIATDEQEKVIDIHIREDGQGEKLIEMFMIAANEAVATYINNFDATSLYRVHDIPNEEKLKKVVMVIENYENSTRKEQGKSELNLSSKINKNKFASAKYISNLLEELKDTQKYETYCYLILRCLSKAKYDINNIGHFGLALKYYTHFTSPIRRYPDTTIHRILKAIIHGNIEKLYTESFKSKMTEVAIHSSVQEQNADKCERESNKMKFAQYMEEHIGEVYTGKISGFHSSGMYVELPKTKIEGRVNYSTMDDYYNYDTEQEILIGERKGKVYRLGDEVVIKVTRASKDAREIDFELELPKTKVRKRRNGNNK